MKIGKELSFGLNLIRVIACILVILLHISGIEFEKYGDNWQLANIVDSFTRVCVPLFIMISGALLINEQGLLLLNSLRRIRRIAVILLFWSLFYLLYDFSWPLGIYDWITRFLSRPMKFHLWYLYATIGFYLAIPILSAIYLRISKRDLLLYLLLWMIVSNIILFDQTFGTSNQIVINSYRISIFSNFLGFLLLGKLVADYFSAKSDSEQIAAEKSKIVSIGYTIGIYLLMSLITALLTYMMTARMGKPSTAYYAYNTPFTIIASAALFLVILQLARYLQKFESQIRIIANCTLGIYCIHVMFIELVVRKPIAYLRMDMGLFAIVLFTIVVFLLSFATCWLMKKVKYLNRVV